MKTPGEKVCEIEEFAPSLGVYVEDDSVYSKFLGEPKFNTIERTVSISPPMKIPGINKEGSIVYGKVFQILDQLVLVSLYPYHTRHYRLMPPSPIGAIHISDIRKEFVEDIYQEFEVGDWVRARVKRIVKRFYPQLTTIGRELGVIKAYCKYDRTPLVRRGADLYCPRCRRSFKRKVAQDYGDPKLPR